MLEPKDSSGAAPPALDIGNVVAAFSEEQIGRLTGLGKSRLRHWARTGFFMPSYIEDDGRLPYSRFYAFKDVVALRVLEMLRVKNGVPLQQLRKVAATLGHLKDDLWVKTTLFVVDKQVVFVDPETDRPQEVVSGQYILGIPLLRVMTDTEAEVAALRRRPDASHGRITRSPAVARNAWVIEGTRVPVASIVRLSEDGYGADEIVAEYPDLTHEDVRAALLHGKQIAA